MSTEEKIFKETSKLDDALKLFFKNFKIPNFKSESVSLMEAKNRVLAKNVKSPVDIPLFDKSAMDGYAVIAEDTFGAMINNPITLTLVGEVSIGKDTTIEVSNEKAAFVYTGSKIPQGANAVIMIEHTNKVNLDKIEVNSSVTPGQNISKIGEDVKENELILKRGIKLKFQDLGMLAAMGFSEVDVLRKPKIAILSTGNELVPVEESGKTTKDIDVNRITISAMCLDIGAEIIDLGIAKDDFKEIKSKIEKGLSAGDIVIVTGGTSVSNTDLTAEVINSIGKPGMIVHGISLRPGKPTGLAIVNDKTIVSLSGYPIAAIVGFEALVKPILVKLQGFYEMPIPKIKAKMIRRVASTLGERNYVRVRVEKSDGDFIASPVRMKGSGILSSMIRANGFLIIPEDREGVDEGEEVEIQLFRPLKDII
jgi:molybdenum cofactor synthesis domain-containing protein